MLECPHLDSIFEVLKRISIVWDEYIMPDKLYPVGIDDICSFSTCFKHILILDSSQLATTNWVKGRRMQLNDNKTCCATTLRQMLRCAQTTNVICVARLSDMLNDPYCPPCVCSTRMACPEILCAPDFVHPHKHQHFPVLLPTDV